MVIGLALPLILAACFGVSERRETRYVDPDEDGVPWPIDCDDQDAEVGTRVWYLDGDGDGLGDALGRIDQCEAPEGAVSVPGDCDDGDATVYPNAPELCDGLDNDCDGEADEDPAEGEPLVLGFPDEDGDGFGEGDGAALCALPEGWVTVSGDCDDGAPGVFPGAAVVCGDEVDQDCDGLSDCGRLLDGEVSGEGALRLVGDEYNPLDGAVVIADLTGDGHPDWILGSTQITRGSNGGVYVLPGPLPLEGEVDVEASAWLISGDTSLKGEMGRSIVVGDVNDDDAVDLIIAAPEGSADPGRVYVAFGPLDAGRDLSVSGADHVLLEGLTGGDGFGDGLVTGQFDDDGQLDVLISSPGAQWNGSTTTYGALHLFLGPIWNNYDAASADLSIALEGVNAVEGVSLANIGDIDADGLDDVAVGLNSWKVSWSGLKVQFDAVHVLSGGFEATSDLDALTSWRVFYPDDGDDFGATVQHAGDLDADGYDELVVSAPRRDKILVDDGAVWVFSGQEIARTGGATDPADAAIAEIVGNAALNQRVGEGLAAPGDVDQDGRADLLVGAPGAPEYGEAFVIYGPAEGLYERKDLDARVTGGAATGTGYGAAVAAPGDINGLGHPDLLLYAPEKFTWHLLFTDAL